MLRTTYGMVLDADAAVARADELIEAAAVLLADAMLARDPDLDRYVATYRQAKAQATLAAAVAEGTRLDWERDREAVVA